MSTLQLTWRRMTADDLARIYEEEMRRDFPKAELKTLEQFLDTQNRGLGHNWAVCDGDKLAAYLLMVQPAGCTACQLDYFAVLPAYRASGLGGQLLAQLAAHEAGAQAILIEAECPEKAPDSVMARRRLGFYARAGAADTGWTEHLLDAWFRILVLPCPGSAPLPPEEAVAQLAQCYRHLPPQADGRPIVTFYRPDGSEERFGRS